MSRKKYYKGEKMQKLLKIEDLVEMGFGCRQTIMKKVFNNEFPCPIKLGKSKRSPIRWIASEVDSFLKNPNLRKHIVTKEKKLDIYIQNNNHTSLIYTKEKQDAINKFNKVDFECFLLRPIEELGLTNYVTRYLKVHNVYLIGQLIQKTEWDIAKMDNLGKKALKEIQDKLDYKGWRLSKIKEQKILKNKIIQFKNV